MKVYLLETIFIDMYECDIVYSKKESLFYEIEKKIDSLAQTDFFMKERLTLKDVAKVIGTNRTYLSNMFWKRKSIGFKEYVMDLKLKSAEQYLKQDISRHDIVVLCGFGSYRTFQRLLLKEKKE